MRYIVSTVKDSLTNVTRFVDENFRSGADFMFIFSEDPSHEVSAYLSAHELVMHIPSWPYGGHWGDERPANIYLRQNTNANLVRTTLAAFPWATWLFHLDGDEVLDIDCDELDSLSTEVSAVRLSPLESVAAMEEGWDGYFKYPLSESNLALLFALGAIDEPTQRALYNGHVRGKVGIRPSLDYRMEIHAAKAGDEQVATYSSEGLRMLHYDSFNADEFVRKWLAKVVNQGVRQRARRRTIRSAVEATIQLAHLTQERRGEILRQIYERHIADDVELLAELGFLTRADQTRHRYEPRHHTPEQLTATHELLMLLKEEDLSVYDPTRPLVEQSQALEKALNRASATTQSMAEMRPSLEDDGTPLDEAARATASSSAVIGEPQDRHGVRVRKARPRRLAYGIPHGVRARIPPRIRKWTAHGLDTILGNHG